MHSWWHHDVIMHHDVSSWWHHVIIDMMMYVCTCTYVHARMCHPRLLAIYYTHVAVLLLWYCGTVVLCTVVLWYCVLQCTVVLYYCVLCSVCTVVLWYCGTVYCGTVWLTTMKEQLHMASQHQMVYEQHINHAVIQYQSTQYHSTTVTQYHTQYSTVHSTCAHVHMGCIVDAFMMTSWCHHAWMHASMNACHACIPCMHAYM